MSEHTKIPHDVKKTLKTLGDTIFDFVLGGFPPTKYRGPVDPNLRNFRSSIKLRYENIIFFKDDSTILLVFVEAF